MFTHTKPFTPVKGTMCSCCATPLNMIMNTSKLQAETKYVCGMLLLGVLGKDIGTRHV